MNTPAPRRIDVRQAGELIAAHMPRYPAVEVPLDHAAGEILREPIVAEREQPPFDRVTMDGIAIRHAAWAAGRRRFTVHGTQAAGGEALALPDDDSCIAIMTGAALPTGADSIVPVERIQREGEHATVEDGYEVAAGQFVHRRGSDHAAGQTLLEPGTRLGAPEMAVATLGGSATVAITRRPAIAVISTGDELVEAGEPIGTFQIRCSNDRAIVAALNARGFRHGTRARLPDDPVALRRDIGELYANHDVLILSGGVSMGEFDYVPRVLNELGMELVFHKILQRPGLPMWFGVSPAGKPVFALPGNPVSSLVCLARHALPALLEAIGARPEPLPRVRLTKEVRFEPDLTYFLPVKLSYGDDGVIGAEPHPTNTSGDFTALAGTDGFVELPRGQDIFPAGHLATFYRW